MFDKIGGSSKIQQSPPGPIDFHGKGNHHLKPVSKITHNASFDNIQVHNQLASHSGQHGSKLVRGSDQSKLIASGQSSIIASHGTHPNNSHAALQNLQSLQNNHGSSQGAGQAQNPQAYDELKKRLLNEYKKLVNNKKQTGSNSDERETAGRNLSSMQHKSAG